MQQMKLSGSIVAVDPWIPYFDTNVNTKSVYSTMNEAAANGTIYRLFLHNIRTAGVAHLIDTRIGKSIDVLPNIPDHSISCDSRDSCCKKSATFNLA